MSERRVRREPAQSKRNAFHLYWPLTRLGPFGAFGGKRTKIKSEPSASPFPSPVHRSVCFARCFFFKYYFYFLLFHSFFLPFSPTAEPGPMLTAELLPHKNLPLITMGDNSRRGFVVTRDAATHCKTKVACVWPYQRLSIEAISCQALCLVAPFIFRVPALVTIDSQMSCHLEGAKKNHKLEVNCWKL